MNDISTTRSKWLLSFVTDLKPFEEFINRVTDDLVAAAALAQQIAKQYGDTDKNNFINTFTGLRNEFMLLTETHQYLRNVFLDYKSVHREKPSEYRFTKRS